MFQFFLFFLIIVVFCRSFTFLPLFPLHPQASKLPTQWGYRLLYVYIYIYIYGDRPICDPHFWCFLGFICCFQLSIIAVAHCLCCLYTPTIHCASPPSLFWSLCFEEKQHNINPEKKTSSDKSTSEPLLLYKTPLTPLTSWTP